MPEGVGVAPFFRPYFQGSRLCEEMKWHKELYTLDRNRQHPEHGRLVPEPPGFQVLFTCVVRVRACVCGPLSLSLSLSLSRSLLLALFVSFSLPSLPLLPASLSHMTIFLLTPERIKSDTSGTRSGDITVNNVERRAPVHYRVRKRRRNRHQEHDTRDGGLFEKQVQRRQRPKSQTRKPHLEIDLHMHL